MNPIIIQGGMGVAVSSWPLAKAVSSAGQLGVVSGTGLDTVLVRRLQLGDRDESLRHALSAFPDSAMADRIWDRYFIPGGKLPEAPFCATPPMAAELSREVMELLIVANFAEIYLAKQGHQGPVGINYLEAIQLPLLPSLFGAMLAGVDYVLMGAGIPRTIPEVIERICQGQVVELPLRVHGATSQDRFVTRFDPATALAGGIPWLERPKFLAIVSSATLANSLLRKGRGNFDGFVVEGPTAGGHNAPPRGTVKYNERGEPTYGPRDEPVLDAFRKLKRPFWLAGEYGAPSRIAEALEAGAAGVQVGTPFAFCDESGITPSIKRRVLAMVRRGQIDVMTDPLASPTGFPFKVLQLLGTLSQKEIAPTSRARCCDLGYLRQAYKRQDGTLGWRCPAEDPRFYLKKGGKTDETTGRKCLCNALMANVGLGQVRHTTGREKELLTVGDDVRNLDRFFPSDQATSFSASDVIKKLLAVSPKGAPSPATL